MIIVTIRTDKPEAELGLYDDQTQLAYHTWLAHRALSVTIHEKIDRLLAAQGLRLSDIGGIVGFTGPGSFTGLRIGLTVANAIAYGLQKPVVGSQGADWIIDGLNRLQQGQSDVIALPQYGAPVHITRQKK